MLAALGKGGARPRPFAPGVPELAQFPFDEWARLLARRWRRPRPEFLVGGAPGGYSPLREALADHLSSARAVACSAAQVIVTSAALIAAGARLVPVPVDGEGLSVAAGRASEANARLACISPSHQYPLGVTMSLKRRLELLEWAREVDGVILEDDYDSEYRYAGRPLAALQGLDRDGRVIYLGTLSKVMFPGLRLGYMVVPEHLVDAFLAVRALIDAHPSSIAQAALADFITGGHLAGHVRRMRLLYAERQAALINALRTRLDGVLTVERDTAGMHLVAGLAAGLDDGAISEQARALGVDAPALSTYYRGAPQAQGLLLGYAGFSEPEMAAATVKLARAVAAASVASGHTPARHHDVVTDLRER